MAVSLLAAVLGFLLWVLAVFIRPIGLGVAHVLLGLSAVLLIRWWALRNEGPRSERRGPN